MACSLSTKVDGDLVRQDASMRCTLDLRSPSNGSGWGETWALSGTDERMLRDALDQLDDFLTEPPLEVWDRHAFRRVIQAEDRWRAAMLVWSEEQAEQRYTSSEDLRAERAWTAEGALALAELLPERLADLREAIRARFTTR
jgi:hypothetical protein